MNVPSGLRSGAAPRLLLFTLLLCLSSVAPVVAAPAEVPTEAEITAALDASFATYQEQQRLREEQLSSPAAIQERKASRYAFSELTPAAAEELLRSRFGEVLEALDKDPSRYLSDAKIERPLGPDAATVTSEGETTLLESSVPVRTPDEDGDLSKVDLSLIQTPEGWEPVNPLVDLEIGESAAEGIEVGEGGLAVTQVGAGESVARPLGDENIFYGEVSTAAADTDLLVSPTSSGVELFNLLRSADSPETLRFHIDMPPGAGLRVNEAGAGEVVGADGSSLMLIAKPMAVDAQGTGVPVTMTADGESIVLRLDHRDEDLAYPILVDPELLYQDWGWWYSGQHLSGLAAFGWAPAPTPWWIHHGTSSTAFPSYAGKGLFISTEPGSLGANQWGHYVYSAPNSNSYLADATVNPFWRENGGCASPNPYYQPYDYVGMWNEGSWNRVLFNKANELGWATLESWGRSLMIGMSTNSGTSIPCWRHLMIGGVGIWLDDWQYPYLDSVGATPEGWVRKDAATRTFSVSASDAGLGVRTVRMFGVGTQKDWLWSKGWCAGTYEQRCLNSDSGQIAFRTDGFPYEGRYNQEGKERKFTVQVIDPTDKRWQIERPLWLDGTPPTVSLEGQLATITGQQGIAEKDQAEGKDELSLPTYKLEVKADDGADRSGVKEIKVFLDGKTTPEQVKAATTCASGGCPQSETMTYTLQLPGLAPGKHSLRIVAVDLVGNESDPNRNIEFEYIPATGMKEEYVLQHFRLPDGNDYSGEAEYHGPEIAVNVINGNVVFHERDVDLETGRGDLELERVYNSQQPTQKDTQWGRGWSIAQTPELEPQPGVSPPQKATVTETGRITSSVPIPQSPSQSTFSSRLHATITKTTTGYEVEPAGESEVEVFGSGGRIEEVVQGDNSPAYLAPEEAEWAPPTPPTYGSSFGVAGFAAGQFKHPAGIAVDGAGSIWVVDQDNDRVQKFNSAGEYQSSFGSSGTGNGQFGRPTDIAIDASGNLWVTDAGNNRVLRFNSKGEFVFKFGSYGTAEGQLNGPESIVSDLKGGLWVADTYNGRLQKFNSFGQVVKTVGSKGSGQGQLLEPTGLDIAPDGSLWVAEWGNNRVSVFNEAGGFVRHVGSSGTGNGQFSRPDVVEVDHKGRVWVGDQNNGRIQQFDQSGAYVTQFGAKGSGAGQFSFGWPMGIAGDPQGRIWISDTGNNRVQRWTVPGALEGGPAPYFDAPVVDYDYVEGKLTALRLEDEATQGEDPSLDLALSSGRVSTLESAEGDTTYAYEADRLATVGGQDGQTKYAYDFSGRLSSVTLPNGTTAKILYDGTSRATSVEVDPAGSEAAKKTSFSYSAEPRRTTVFGGGNPQITYDIGEDGSVLKWAYAETPPTIPSISGSLWSKQGQEIENSDHTLFVTGSSPHQVASIKVVANNNSVVAEKTCKDPAEPPSHVCEQWKLEWITHASEHAPGRMDLEVIVTDFLGHQTAERFFVLVPQQPPPGPEEVERPSFASIKLFREEYGLDRNKSLTESQLNELTLELLYEWEKQDFTAMTAVENWGVPMRAPELAEMEWRREYTDRAADVIPEWAEEHTPSTYGGFYVDDRAGGLIYVGFTTNQQALIEALKQDPRLLATGQIREFPTPPANSVASLEAMAPTVTDALVNEPSIEPYFSSVQVIPDENIIYVGATEPAAVRNFLSSRFGQSAPISVSYEERSVNGSSRYAATGPVVAGAALIGDQFFGCTAGFGSKAPAGQQRGQTQDRYFTLTAGHCYAFEEIVGRRTSKNASKGVAIGLVTRRDFSGSKVVDGEGILVDKSLRSHSVLNGSPMKEEPIQGAQKPQAKKFVCWSGVSGGSRCGKVLFRREAPAGAGQTKAVYVTVGLSISGDSGGPVWNPRTHNAVGLITGGTTVAGGDCWEISGERTACNRMTFTPLLQSGGSQGILPTLGLEILEEG